jgi:hypothetical protein
MKLYLAVFHYPLFVTTALSRADTILFLALFKLTYGVATLSGVLQPPINIPSPLCRRKLGQTHKGAVEVITCVCVCVSRILT